MPSPDPSSPQPLKCTSARFVEVAFPRLHRPRLVIAFGEGFTILLEDRDAVPLAADFIAALRTHLAAKGVENPQTT